MQGLTASISMSEPTVECLTASRYTLDAFRVVKTNDDMAMPTVWMSTTDYGPTTNLTWSEQVRAYTSRTAVAVANTIAENCSFTIEPGQLLIVSSDGNGAVTNDGIPRAVNIGNTSGQRFTVGVSASIAVQGNEQSTAPLCAVVLFGQDLKLIELTTKVLLVMSGSLAAPGTVVDRSEGPGVMVEFAGAQEGVRSLTYDLNDGWSWDNAPWAYDVPPLANLKSLLAIRSEQLVRLAEANFARLLARRP